ncbi:midasin isoform X3 [Ciona intestinalis]
MEHFHADIHNALKRIVLLNPLAQKALQKYLAKQIWTSSDRAAVLQNLSKVLLKSNKPDTLQICHLLGPIAVDLLLRISISTGQCENHLDTHERICVMLGWLCKSGTPSVHEFALSYLRDNGPPFKRLNDIDEVTCEKSKRTKVSLDGVEELIEATHALVMKFPELLESDWCWSRLADYLHNNYSHITSRCHQHLIKILSNVVGLCGPDQCENILEIKNKGLSAINGEENLEVECSVTTPNAVLTHTRHAIVSKDLSENLTSICGVLVLKQPGIAGEFDLVMTDMLKDQLQKLAVAISLKKSILLEGPVGCGKTALIENVAKATGRAKPPKFSKIQLSDDTDSKTLTGTYVCTAVPGEFLWQPGLLIQACKDGDWLLLEDVDRAPMDVISMLLPLVESRRLSIPGRPDQNNAVSPDFRLFMTRRVTMGASFVGHLGLGMLSKHVNVISMDAISANDLKQIMLHKYPKLGNVAEKLLTIYLKLTEHESANISMTKRKLSTRDLLKWCHRVEGQIIETSATAGIGEFVALSAIDCLVASSWKPESRISMIETICAELNIGTEKAKYFSDAYRPEVEIDRLIFKVGKTSLPRLKQEMVTGLQRKQLFAHTRHSCVLLERVAGCVETSEPVLLVGETGVGKTSVLQYLAQETGHRLHVVNMSQQSSSGDLLGGFKPAQIRHFVAPVREKFEEIFPKTFCRNQNMKFLSHIQTCYSNKRYNDLLKLMSHVCEAAFKRLSSLDEEENLKLSSSWKQLTFDLEELRLKVKSDSAIAFNFVEGELARCLRLGEWILLDEINLAPSDALECLSGVLESEAGSIVLLERGDSKPVERHKNFRLFAAMNPATDVGKRNLSDGIRNRFTEFFVDEPSNHKDLADIVDFYLDRNISGTSVVEGVVTFYNEVRKLAVGKLVDGSGRKPHYSLRTLCRALNYVKHNANMTLHVALYEGFCMSFSTALDKPSSSIVVGLIGKHIVGKNKLKSVLNRTMPIPDYECLHVEKYYIRRGSLAVSKDPNYIMTPSIRENLIQLSRPVSYGKHPILIEGATSTGKTSLITYLGRLTGNKVVRINNHEHTDIQEYVGSYASDSEGRLVFQDGPLVTAMREGNWVILDELNLAPTDILEALNRVLDDNREIFITETQEVVRAHPRFTLFATQNPPGSYGGRKVLSRAFRNRFVELHFNEIPTKELETILHERCHLAPAHCKKLVKVMQDLQARRRASGLFAGKHGFITLRDLFRWAERHRKYERDSCDFYDWEQHLVDDGFLLLAGRVRKLEEEKVIEEVLSKYLGRKVDRENLFGTENVESIIKQYDWPEGFDHVVWTQPMRRLFVTLERALRFNEPVLLVGETGGGKTTACQLMAAMVKKKLSIVNCHANTEAADFIGGLRPTRSQSKSDSEKRGLFEWVDGPLVASMRCGTYILVDEISLADDSVLERLNSVLEPERTLVIPDKISMSSSISDNDGSFVVADTGFQFMSTMNPGGDFGKKELSPALRNRMTEIWCSGVNEHCDLINIVQHNLKLNHGNGGDCDKTYASLVVEFVEWFKSTLFGKRFVISVRDLLTWASFMRTSSGDLDLPSSFVHAACLVYIDGLGSGLSAGASKQSHDIHSECLRFVLKQLRECGQVDGMSPTMLQWVEGEIQSTGTSSKIHNTDETFGIEPFSVRKGPAVFSGDFQFTFHAPTTSTNALRVLRALQLPRPILLEGSPGGGKTSLVAAIAKYSGHELVRINLSEQTDASDLFGADLPVEGGSGGEFSWRDGPLLSAMKKGHWVVLDELNLASQSVLESLNSVFDHRGELYVPELARSFLVNRDQTKIFACQNPVHEGGGRRGLPKSFLNRFTQVYVRGLAGQDMEFILNNSFSQIPPDVMKLMVKFNQQVNESVVVQRSWGHRGSPWEFNLRDITRWCQLVVADLLRGLPLDVAMHVYTVYCARLRSKDDRQKMMSMFRSIFGVEVYEPSGKFHISSRILQVGGSTIERTGDYFADSSDDFHILPSVLKSAESLITGINQKWPCIVTGSSGSGKSRLVKTVAKLAGRKLRILSTNSEMDAVELLGGFEQHDIVKNLMEFVMNVKRRVVTDCQDCVSRLPASNQPKQFNKLMLKLTFLLKKIENLNTMIKLVDSFKVNDKENRFVELENQISMVLGTSMKNSEYKELLAEWQNLKLSEKSHGSYEWMDSVLVHALKNGEWLLIDGANFCSASVLDRMNALLEPQGVLAITERGIVQGEVPTITPHPDFRLILALDPTHGDLSRAMRNRCLEISLLPLDVAAEQNIETILMESEVATIAQAKSLNLTEFKICGKIAEDWKEKNNGGTQNVSDGEMLKILDSTLEEVRRGLYQDFSQISGSDDSSLLPRLKFPTTSDYQLNPILSNVLQQFQIFKFLLNYFNSHDFNIGDVIQSFSQILVESANYEDWEVRGELLDVLVQAVLGKTGQPEDLQRKTKYNKFFSELLSGTFSSVKQETHRNVLPWDPRWNLQLMKQLVTSCLTEDNLKSANHALRIYFKFLKLEEDLKFIEFSKRRTKKNVKNATILQLCHGLSTGKVYLGDLPNNSLQHLYQLYSQWCNLQTELPTYIKHEIDEIECEGIMRQISYIWRYFMTQVFRLPMFTTWFVLLKQLLQKFTTNIGCTEHNIHLSIDAISGALNLSAGREIQLQNKIRCNLFSTPPFENEENFNLKCRARKLLQDLSDFVVKVFQGQLKTGLNWSSVCEIAMQILDVGQSEEANLSMEVDGEDRDPSSILASRMKSCGIPVSKDLCVSKPLTDEDHAEKQDFNISTFGVTTQDQKMWNLYDFYRILVTMGTLHEDLEFDSRFLFTGFDVTCQALAAKSLCQDGNFNKQRFLLQSMWKQAPVFKEIEAEVFMEDSHDPSDLLKAGVSESVALILYGAESSVETEVKSYCDFGKGVFDSVAIPLREFDEKVLKLETLKKALWVNSVCFKHKAVCDVIMDKALYDVTMGVLTAFLTSHKAICDFGTKMIPQALKEQIQKFCAALENLLTRNTAKDVEKNKIFEILSQFQPIQHDVILTTVETDWFKTILTTYSKCVNLVLHLLHIIQGSRDNFNTEDKDAISACWETTSEMWVWCGVLQFTLVTPRGKVDPIEKHQAKSELLNEEANHLRCILSVRNLNHQWMTGRDLWVEGQVIQPDCAHPHVQSSLDHLDHVTAKANRNAEKVAYRPKDSQFIGLSNECHHFAENIISVTALEGAIEQLKNKTNYNAEDWIQKSLLTFTKSLEGKYPAYPDFVAPVVDAIQQMRFGLRILKGVSQLINTPNNSTTISTNQFINGVVSTQISTEINDYLDAEQEIKSLLQRKVSSVTQGVQRSLEECVRVLFLVDVTSLVRNNGYCDVTTVLSLLESIVANWNEQQEKMEREEAAKASLFKYKVEKHENNEDDDEEKEFEEMFPGFNQGLIFGEDVTLDGTADNITHDAQKDLSEKLFEFAVLMHREIITATLKYKTKEKGKNVSNLETLFSNKVMASLLGHHMIAPVIRTLYPWLRGQDIDHGLMRFHVMAAAHMKNLLTNQISLKNFNVYSDSCPHEVSRCIVVLQDLYGSVSKHLEEWPEHPVLGHLVVIIDRILSFSVNEPIMKYISGLELLLEKSQEWELNASRHVSLFRHLEEITTLILDWRKMELKGWYRLLDQAESLARSSSTKWWFYVYQLVEDCVRKSDEANYSSIVDDVITSMQKFVESSSLIEFVDRVGLLKLFHQHLIFKGESRNKLCMVLHNLASYYEQFIETAQNRIQSVRKPIEKDLKNFVKIAKWNDINFYAVKDSTAKTHRSLFKFVKKYRQALKEPCSLNVLKSNSSTKFNKHPESFESKGKQICQSWKAHTEDLLSTKPKSLEKIDIPKNIQEVAPPSCKVLPRLSTVSAKLRKHCLKWQKNENDVIPNDAIAAEETIGDVIETFIELRSLEPTTPSSSDKDNREKRLSEAKHIQARKRKTLSELFKLLTSLGVSYRKGLVHGKELTSHKIMCSPSPSSGEISGVLSDTTASGERYFHTMVSRWSMLNAAMVTPNKQVGISNLDRMRGSTNHILRLAVNQRGMLSRMNEVDELLKDVESSINECIHDPVPLPPQQEAFEKFHSILTVTSQWLDDLNRFKILLESCPNADSLDLQHNYIGSNVTPLTHGGKHWLVVMATVESEIKSIETLKSTMETQVWKFSNKVEKRIKPGCFVTKSCVDLSTLTLETLCKSSESVTLQMVNIFEPLKAIETPLTGRLNELLYSPMLVDIIRGRNLISSLEGTLFKTPNQVPTVSKEELLGELDTVISKILLAVQNLVQITEDVPTEEESLKDKLLAEHLHNKLEKKFKELKLSEIEQSVLRVMGSISEVAGSGDNDFNKLIHFTMMSLCPVMRDYHDMVRQVHHSMAVSHRTLCKFNSVLLSMFSEITAKGFCPPSEFEDELSDDKGELKDVEDAGIGEGQGAKDVSDQIETEDQVEDSPDAKNEEDQDDDVAPEDEAIEMSNDFDGKMEDGGDKEGSENEEEMEDLEKQMGDLGEEGDVDKLDERMWGSEDEDEEEKEGGAEEKGGGVDAEESELGAKDDEMAEGKSDEKQEEKQQEETPQEENKQEEINIGDQSEFDPNEKDDCHENEPPNEPEAMEIPEDLKLDDEDGSDHEDGEREDELDKEEKSLPEKMGEDDDVTKEDDDVTKEDDDVTKEEDDVTKDDDDVTKDDDDVTKEDDDVTKDDDDVKNNDEDSTNDDDDVTEDMDTTENLAPSKDEEEQDLDGGANEEEEEKDNNINQQTDGNQLPMEEEKNDEVKEKISRKDTEVVANDAVQSEEASEKIPEVSKEEGKEEENTGTAPSSDATGQDSNTMTSQRETMDVDNEEMTSQSREAGKSDVKRSLAEDKKFDAKRLRTLDDLEQQEVKGQEKKESDIYQHIEDDKENFDQVTLDAATEEQMKNLKQSEDYDVDNDDDDVIEEKRNEEKKDSDVVTMATEDDKESKGEKSAMDGAPQMEQSLEGDEETDLPENDLKTEKVYDEEMKEEREFPQSSIHTNEYDWSPTGQFQTMSHDDFAKLRQLMEENLTDVNQSDINSAESMWQQYQSLTQHLSQQLSEQLRLVLEPTKAAKLKGDYRTGKRLNMRKVIPYIASGFRKDKIWLRRSKPSKREYQIMVAIDDSSSMADNHTKQLAFESLAVVSSALTTLEAGQLGVCSFGDDTKLLHNFDRPFTDQSGASIIHECTFEQKQTKIAKLLNTSVDYMKTARSSFASSADPRLSQLLLIISDGRGLYIEGREKVTTAIRAAVDSKIFIAFIILDNPKMKDSILDIKVPVFNEAGKLPEIRSYMNDFPFPFYVIIRDVNVLPETLSDALRQWFEVVTNE